MAETTAKAARNAEKSSLATIAAAITKNILGAELAKPAMIKVPRAVAEIHVSRDDVIPAGTVITDKIAEIAGLDTKAIDDLEDQGFVDFVEVYAQAVAEDAAQGADSAPAA